MQQGRGPVAGRGGPPPSASASAVQKFKERVVHCRFVEDSVMELCVDLGRELAQQVSGMQRENSLTQVRKFFNQVRVLQNEARATPDFASVRPRLRVLQAQVSYAVARNNLTGAFREWFDAAIQKVVNSSNGRQDLEDFAKLFEAVYAYFYFEQQQKKRQVVRGR